MAETFDDFRLRYFEENVAARCQCRGRVVPCWWCDTGVRHEAEEQWQILQEARPVDPFEALRQMIEGGR